MLHLQSQVATQTSLLTGQLEFSHLKSILVSVFWKFWLRLFFHLTWVKNFKSVSCQLKKLHCFYLPFPRVLPFAIAMFLAIGHLVLVFWSIVTFHYPMWLWDFYNPRIYLHSWVKVPRRPHTHQCLAVDCFPLMRDEAQWQRFSHCWVLLPHLYIAWVPNTCTPRWQMPMLFLLGQAS